AYPRRCMAEAGYERALLYLDSGNTGSASPWVEKALSYCGDGCEARGRILNLKARAALALKDYATAARCACEALALNRENRDFEEEANSLRFEAEARAMSGRHVEAMKLYGLALGLDKDSGLGRKMAYDLLGMGRVSCAMGENGKGRGYLYRALVIAGALNDGRTGRKISAVLKKCGQ
ncbi:MAG: hypothetical protein M0Z75_00320, partial [Nitrospiraceae bacterium]|nr:hypothetical protein [Nitrospiraceae bacterium]